MWVIHCETRACEFSFQESRTMKRFFAFCVALSLATVLFTGCEKKAEKTTETTVETPGGETTTTESTTVEKSGENPPPANP
jgi:hypothetical protein